MRLLTLAGVLVLIMVLPAFAGPWPRGEGKAFVSVSGEIRADLENLLIPPEYDGSLYGEYGVGPKLTLGVDAYKGPRSETVLLFLRRTLTAPDRKHQFSARFGVGTRGDETERSGLALVGASWGMGFGTRWGNGWSTLDGQIRSLGSGGSEYKLDATVGLRPNDDWAGIAQVQASEFPGSERSARVQLSAVRRLNKTFSAEVGLVYGIENDTRIGLKLGLWSEF